MKSGDNPMQRRNCQAPALRQCQKCGAKTRRGSQCQSPAVKGRQRCRMHGLDNLYVAGSSVFPTGLGYANPTLTVVALAVRLADHLKERGAR